MRKYLLVFLLATACAPSVNSAISPIQGKDGKKIGTMNVSVKTEFGNTTMTAISNSGEMFKGEVVTDKIESESYSSGAGNSKSKSSRGTSKSSTSASAARSSTKYSSKAYAMLLSNKGDSMECDIRLSNPRYGLSAGGSGKCKISDGRIVPISISNN